MLLDYFNKIVEYIGPAPVARLDIRDLNAKTMASYNAQKTLKGDSEVHVLGCGHRTDGRMDHIGIDDWPVGLEEHKPEV